MQIISKYRDYYDTVEIYGLDKSIHYQRYLKSRKIDLKKYRQVLIELHDKVGLQYNHNSFSYYKTNCNSQWFNNKKESIYLGYLGFCGFAYPIFVTTWGITSNYQGILNLLDKPETRKIYRQYFEEENPEYNQRNRMNSLKFFSKEIAKKIESKGVFKIPDALFFNLECPVYLYLENVNQIDYNPKYFKQRYKKENHQLDVQNKIILNPILSALSFSFFKDPFSCFQSLAIYQSSVLAQLDKIYDTK